MNIILFLFCSHIEIKHHLFGVCIQSGIYAHSNYIHFGVIALLCFLHCIDHVQILQSLVQFREYPTTKTMEEAVEEDAYPPSLRVVVTQHFPAHRYTATKQAHLAILGTNLDTLIVPINVMELEGHSKIGDL